MPSIVPIPHSLLDAFSRLQSALRSRSHMPSIERDKNLHVRLSKDEMDMLESLADAEGVTVSALVRQFIRRAWTEHKKR